MAQPDSFYNNRVVNFLTYEETVAYILDIPRFTKKNEISHTREFLRRLKDPQDSFPVIHVAGSNGKGSVCAFLDSVLRESGLKTGLFTSPHLISIRERFRIQGEPCTREQFLAAEQIVRSVVQGMQRDGLAHPTFFEYIFAIGMVLFRQAGVDCAVLETGMGGRLDATNVVKHPILTVITSISLEHTEILGDTIEAIAAEKAGIIKSGVPVLFDGNEPKATPVILQAARKKQAPAEEISMGNIKILLNDGKHIDFSLENGYDVTNVRIPFPAEYQVRNGALALAAVNRLKDIWEISDEAAARGFQNAKWPGRMEELYPDVYLDGAHNISGVQAFLEAAGRVAESPSILLFSMVKEKNYQEALGMICQVGNWEEIILTQISDNPRALSAEQLRQGLPPGYAAAGEGDGKHLDADEERQKVKILTIKEPREALAQAMADKKPGQKLFCAGSLYLIGELEKIAGGYKDDQL